MPRQLVTLGVELEVRHVVVLAPHRTVGGVLLGSFTDEVMQKRLHMGWGWRVLDGWNGDGGRGRMERGWEVRGKGLEHREN